VLLCTSQNVLLAQPTEQFLLRIGEPGPLIEHVGNMIRLQDGNLMLCGQWSDGRPFLQKTDPAGRKIYRKFYFLPGNDGVLSDLVELPNGNIAATGACRNCIPGDSSYTLMNLLSAPDGTLLHLQKHGTPFTVDYGHGIDHIPGGGLAVTGTASGTDSSFLYLYDDALFLQNAVYFKDPGSSEEFAYDVKATGTGHLFITGRSNVGFRPYLLLKKFTATGNGLWSKRFYEDNFTGQTRGLAVEESATGSIVVCGSRYHNPARNGDIFLTEFTADTAAILTERFFGTGQIDEGYALARAGNGWLLGGIIRQPLSLGALWRAAFYQLDASFNLMDSVVYDITGRREFPSGVAPLDDFGKDFAYCGITISQSYQEQDIYWGRHLQRGRLAVVEEFPRPLQLFPRNLNTNLGEVPVRGYVTDSTLNYTHARLQIYRDRQLHQVMSQPLQFVNDTARFSFTYLLPAELHQYDIELGLGSGLLEDPEASAIRVVAGDAYLLTGQSNAVGRQRGMGLAPENEWIRTYGSGKPSAYPEQWFIGQPNADMNDDGNIGQLAARFGGEIVSRQGIPVAIINGGHNGQNIGTFVPNPFFPPASTNYGRSLLRSDSSGLREHIRSIIFWQGESDVFQGTLPGFYFPRLDSIRRSWLRDYPLVRNIFMVQPRNGCTAPLQGLERTIGGLFDYADTVPEVHLLSTAGLVHLFDSCHFDYSGGYEDMGLQLYDYMRPYFYGGPVRANTGSPAPDSAWFPDCDLSRIHIALRTTGDSYSVAPSIGPDFLLSDTGVHVVSANMNGHVLELQLDDSLIGNATISYYGHMGPVQPALLNARGIGLLSFSNLPVNCRVELPVIGRPPRGLVKISVRAQIISVSHKSNGDHACASVKLVGGRLLDLLGREVWRGNAREMEAGIRPGNRSQAVYILQLEYSDGGIASRRIFVN
jgi:hypothetical protein